MRKQEPDSEGYDSDDEEEVMEEEEEEERGA